MKEIRFYTIPNPVPQAKGRIVTEVKSNGITLNLEGKTFFEANQEMHNTEKSWWLVENKRVDDAPEHEKPKTLWVFENEKI